MARGHTAVIVSASGCQDAVFWPLTWSLVVCRSVGVPAVTGFFGYQPLPTFTGFLGHGCT